MPVGAFPIACLTVVERLFQLVQCQVRQALDMISEGMGTTNILNELEHNTLQTTIKSTSFVLSAGFLT